MDNIMRKFFSTEKRLSPFILRLTAGVVMLPHGLQKTLGLFGGPGFSGTMNMFTEHMGLPSILTFLIIACESAGSISLLLGFATRFCAASLAVLMLGAIHMVHWPNGFFMNWIGTQKGEGFEYHILVIGIAVSLVISGAGAFSVDRCISEKLNKGGHGPQSSN